jgi:hypothetical protein
LNTDLLVRHEGRCLHLKRVSPSYMKGSIAITFKI